MSYIETIKNERPKLKISLTNLEWILLITSILSLIFIWVYLILNYGKLPQRVPTHTDFLGKINSWGGKGMLFFLPILQTFLFLLLTIVSKYPHKFNYTVTITAENAERQYRNSRTLMRWITLTISIVFSYIEWNSIKMAKNSSMGFGIWFVPVFIVIMFGIIGIYIYKMIKLK
jgi:uncharacterized membrane protein